VGKTVTAINLAAALGSRQRSTLLVDMDPQGHSSLSFPVAADGRRTVYGIFRQECAVRDAILSVKEEGIDLLTSDIELAKIERDLVGEIDGHFRLKDILAPIARDYEFIVIDTPPALGMLTINCLVAADYLIVPIQSSYLSLEGTEDLLDTVDKIRARFNPNLRILGALVTIHDKRTVLGQDAVRRIKEMFGDAAFETLISKSVRLEESPAYRESIFRYAPDSVSAEEYLRLSEEVIERVNASRPS
jgi:chromosome partitioning protein